MDSLTQLEELFAHFPGIGPRQAKRFVYYLLGKSPAYLKEFAQLINDIKKSSKECDQCHRFFVMNSDYRLQVTDICPTCSDPNRDHTTLMIVARDSDFETIEKSGVYKGLYFILGGTVPILDKEPDKRIRLKRLLEQIMDSHFHGNDKKFNKNDTKLNSDPKAPSSSLQSPVSNLKEIILSLNTTPDGEHTANIVREALTNITKKAGTSVTSPKITILGRGLSTGAELEYADSETIKNALSNRK